RDNQGGVRGAARTRAAPSARGPRPPPPHGANSPLALRVAAAAQAPAPPTSHPPRATKARPARRSPRATQPHGPPRRGVAASPALGRDLFETSTALIVVSSFGCRVNPPAPATS